MQPVHFIKRETFRIVRATHKHFAAPALPNRLAIYFHALERHHWPAFRLCLQALADAGYRSVPLSEFLCRENSKCRAHDRLVFISFDDNYKSWHRALPVLEELRVRATFYTNTRPFRDRASRDELAHFFAAIAHSGERVSLSRSELLEIAAAGHEIACHTHSHPVLSSLPERLWDTEIRRSKDILEDLLDREIPHFSYPYGMRRHFSQALREYCKSVGFHTIATGIPGLQHADEINPFELHRTQWALDRSVEENFDNLRINGRLFERLTGRSAIG